VSYKLGCRALEGDDVALQLLPVNKWWKAFNKLPPGTKVEPPKVCRVCVCMHAQKLTWNELPADDNITNIVF
jgi:hypothetical protein